MPTGPKVEKRQARVKNAATVKKAVARDVLSKNQVRFLLHGPDQSNDDVSALVFASKLGTLVNALRAADRALNGSSVHEYVIAKLHTSTPTVVLSERPIDKQYDHIKHGLSGIAGFQECTDAVVRGNRERALFYGTCPKLVSKLAKGSPEVFGYAEVWTTNQNVIRIDDYLKERAIEMIDLPHVTSASDDLAGESREWFKGVSRGEFDGKIKAVDLRGSLPEIKLVLSAGGKEIDCICRDSDKETIRNNLDRRVRIAGPAFYDGSGGLPRRIEVAKITPVVTQGDFSKWRGSFEPFEIADDWEGDVA